DGILFVKSYRKVIIKDIYPGINWIFRYDDNGNFHHEFELKDPQLISQIKLKVKYADIELADNGKSIILSTPIGKIKDGSLVGYQGNNIVEVSYRLIDNNLIAFDIKNFDKDKSLLIDPYALVWSTCYGGIFGSKANYVITDTQGNIFITGSTASFDFPVYDPGGGAYFDGTCDVSDCESGEAFILKFTNSGVRLWATYYGGSKWDEGSSITTDVNGNVFVTGYTSSTDFPTYNPGGGAYFQGSNAGYFDAFILKFNNSGVRLWATYYGGSSDDVGGSSYDVGSSITTDEQGNVFVTGTTRSTDFPTYNPGDGAYFDGTCGTDGNCNYNYNDIFILKFNNSGVRLWATYYGGSNWECYTSRCHIATDGNNNLFVTGHTDSNDFPTYDPQDGTYFDGTCGNDGNCNEDIFGYHSDAFILKFDSLGKRLWATYYGGVNFDYANFIAIDKKNNVYIVGNTNSIDFPIQNPGNGAYFDNTCCSYSCYDPPYFCYYIPKAFISKFKYNGILEWSTYYGGSKTDEAHSIALDTNGSLFVTGRTFSSDFPVLNPGSGAYFQGSCSGCPGKADAFILEFDSLGVRKWATYYGGSNEECYDAFCSIVLDIYGNLFLTSKTSSSNFPTYNPGGDTYFQECNIYNYGDFLAFISKFSATSSLREYTTSYYKTKLISHLKNFPTPITIKIYSLDGKLIYSNIFKTNNIEINLKGLKSGIYILKAYSKDNKQLTYKFIKN
ncbi:MAG: SBBP repeat-containing protein, partial [candidate division WOR-3 bacterium]